MDFVWRDDAGLQPRRAGPGVALKLLVALTTGGFLLGLLFSTAPLPNVLASLRGVRPEWLAGAVLAVAAAYALRVARWILMLRRAGARVRFRDAAVPLLGAAALDNLLPLGAGEAIRVIALQSFTGRSGARPFGTLAHERRLEAVAGVVVVAASALAWRADGPHAALYPGLLAAVAAMLVCTVAYARSSDEARPSASAGSAWERTPAATLTAAGALSLGICLADGCGYFAVAEALGIARALPTAALAAGLIGVSTLLPAPPGRLGVFDYAAALAASVFGASLAQALAFALLGHAVVWIATTVAGWRLLAAADRIGVARGPLVHLV